MKKAKQHLRTNWRFKKVSPSVSAELRRKDTDEEWTRAHVRRLKLCKPDEVALFNGIPELLKEADGELRLFKKGLWAVYIDCAADQKTTKDWGIMVRVAPGAYYTSPKLVHGYISSIYDEETYSRFKAALWADEDSLRESLNMAARYLARKGWEGMSFWCSESSRRLLSKLGCRIERDWVFLFGHYSF